MRKISNITPNLQEIYRQVTIANELGQKIQAYLPPHLSKHCLVGSFTEGCLVLITTDSAWASELRYMLPELRDKLRATGVYKLTNIKISIAADLQKTELKKNIRAEPISLHAKETIKATAEKCSYLPLRQALLKLAK